MSAVKLTNLNDGQFRLDGGAMFGVVPRVLWAKNDPPDEWNRILLGLHCLLVEGPDFKVLIDTGVGNKEGDKFADMFALTRTADLFDGLAAHGLEPEAITHVINTHLHFDHAGGNTRLNAAGEPVPSFPNARYIVQRGEWEDAVNPNEVTRASYLQRNLLPTLEAGQLDLVEGECEVLPGITVLPAPGHTPHHQCVLIDLGERKVWHTGDLIPTSNHLPLPWIMAYDLFPLDTLAAKRRLLERQRAENWLVYFEHERTAQPFGELEWVEHKKKERPVFRPLPIA
ncbi:MAG: MBL fold metallo-hydrolase [bacterium]|nr:MBL fold metallo-hydrolase [bacterium]